MAGTLEDVAWDLEPLVDGEGEAGVDRLLDEAQERSAALRRALPGQGRRARRRRARRGRGRAAADLRARRARRHLRDAALRDRHRRPRQRRAAAARAGAGDRVETQLLFFELEWAALDDERADELLAADGLDTARHYLRTVRRYRPHLLTEPEEKILAEKARHRPRRLGAAVLRADQRGRGRRSTSESRSRSTSRWRGCSRPTARCAQRRRAGGHRRARSRACARARTSSTRCWPTRRPTTGCAATRRWLSSRNLANEASDESVAGARRGRARRATRSRAAGTA